MLRKTPSWWLVLLMYRGKFLRRNNLHLLSSVCLCGLFHGGVIYCSTVSSFLISHSSDWDVIFFPFWCLGWGKWKCCAITWMSGRRWHLTPIATSLFFITRMSWCRAFFWEGYWRLQDIGSITFSSFSWTGNFVHYLMFLCIFYKNVLRTLFQYTVQFTTY